VMLSAFDNFQLFSNFIVLTTSLQAICKRFPSLTASHALSCVCAACKHPPPYGQATPAHDINIWKFVNKDGNTITFPDGANHFESYSPCLGKQTMSGKLCHGKPCSSKRMLRCWYCPPTRFQILDESSTGKEFTSWKNAIACRTPGDMVESGRGHVEATGRSWHKFWYAVHHLPKFLFALSGEAAREAVVEADMRGEAAAAAAAEAAEPAPVKKRRIAKLTSIPSDSPKDMILLIQYLRKHAQDFKTNKDDFKTAGLLGKVCPENVCPEEHDAIKWKFMQAESLLDHFKFKSQPKTTTKKKKMRDDASSKTTPAHTPAESVDPDEDGVQHVGEEQQRVKVELVPPPPPPKQGTSEVAAGATLDQLPYLPPAAAGGSSGAVVAAYNIYELELEVFACLSPNYSDSFKLPSLSPSPREFCKVLAEIDGLPLFDDAAGSATASQAEDKHTSPAASGAHTRAHTHI